jgi:DDE family transposase
MLMIAAGYADGNDVDSLRADAMFKLALDRLPSDEELCSQSVLGLGPGISRLENRPDRRALLRLGRALIEQYCTSDLSCRPESRKSLGTTGNLGTICDPHLFHYISDMGLNRALAQRQLVRDGLVSLSQPQVA